MKPFLISLCLWAGVAGQSLAQQTTVVNRWVSPVTKDFMSYPENVYTDSQLISWGYTQKPFSLRLTPKDPTATM